MSQVKTLKVFLASPSDVAQERKLVEELIEEINSTTAPSKGVELQLVSSNKHTYPGFNPQGGQAVINSQVRIEEYELFVGIMWNRMGSPTSCAESGTIEEFERAVKAFESNGKPNIWFYFGNSPAQLNTQEDLEQRRKLLIFKEELQNRALTRDYANPDSFQDQFRQDLAKWLEDWRDRTPPDFFAYDDAWVGREQTISQLKKKIEETCRILILVGITGIGKTALAEKLAVELQKWFDEDWRSRFRRANFENDVKSTDFAIVTSQDLPLQLVDSRYSNFWHRQIVYGLEESEQEQLFEITGFDVSDVSPSLPLLKRLGKAYQGHPLVLRVIIGEIKESFQGNVQAYWNDVQGKVEEVEKALAEAEEDARKVVGADDDWKLHKLTYKVRLQVNKQRLQAVFNRLKTQVRDAYIMICAASVYRAPVQAEGWLMQLMALVRRLEKQSCSEERKEKALEELSNRFLTEESVNHNNKRVLGQHNLVRSVALEHYKQLLDSLKCEERSA